MANPPVEPSVSIHVPKGPPGGPPIDSVAGQVSHEGPASPVAKTLMGREIQKQNQSKLQEIESIIEQIKEINAKIDDMPMDVQEGLRSPDSRVIVAITRNISELFVRIKKINNSEQRNNLEIAIKKLAKRADVDLSREEENLSREEENL